MTFKLRKGFLIAVCVFGLFFVLFAAVGIKQSGLNGDSSVALFGVAFFLIVAVVGYILYLDVKINEDGVCRIFFRKQVLFLKWLDVKVIQDVEIKSLGARNRYIYIIPCASVSLSFWSGGRIRFPTNMYDFPKFADEINKYLRANNIKVERMHDAEVAICDEISARDKQALKFPDYPS